MDLLGTLGGRKFLTFLVISALIACRHFLNLTDMDIQLIAGFGGLYQISQGIADGLSKGSTSSTVQAQENAAAEIEADKARADVTAKALEGLAKALAANQPKN